MVDVDAELKRRKQLQQDRMKKKTGSSVPLVRVVPVNDTMRRTMRHPDAATQFGDTGSVEWPMDQFTQRRLRDGAIKLEDDEAQGKVHVRSRANPVPDREPTAEQQHRMLQAKRSKEASQNGKPKEREPSPTKQ